MQLSVSLFDAVAYPAGWKHQEEIAPERRREVICLWIDLPELRLPSPIHLHDRDEAIGRLFQMIYGEAKAAEGVLAYVVQYLHAHYTEPITLEQLAQMEHISKSYLSRRFRQQTGMSVIRYVNRLRVEAAKRLLIGSKLRVNEIAYQVGFESPKYFYRVFKAAAGASPAAFRKSYTSERTDPETI